MNTLLKIGLVGGLIGILYFGSRLAQRVINGLSYKITDFGLPRINNANLTVPIGIEFKNDSPVPIHVDSLRILASHLRNGQYVQVGFVERENFSISPGTSTVTLSPVLDLRALTGNIWQSLVSALENQSVNLRFDTEVTVLGITANESINHVIKLT